MNKFLIKVMTVAAFAIGGGAVVSQATTVHAAAYKIVKTKKYATKTPFYYAGKGNAYMWNKTHTKKILNLKNHPGTQWYRSESVIMQNGSKKGVYYKMVAPGVRDHSWDGYVARSYLTKGYGPNYVGQYRIGFYKLNEDTQYKVLSKSSNKKTTVTIPKGTILGGQSWIQNQKVYYQLNLQTASHELRDQLGVSDAIQTVSNVLSTDVLKRTAPSYLTALSQPDYVVDNNTGGVSKSYSIWKNQLISGSSDVIWSSKMTMLRTTTDGYVETYDNVTTDGITYKKPSLPTASQKITKAVREGNTIVLYYANHLAGISDEKIGDSGDEQYKLAIRKLGPDTDNKYTAIDNYLVGGQEYHAGFVGY
ncbi:hypothetical protein [Lentilactobacillus sp. Marseille-Q4993]|uniref:hypothetical protein n=1 Tax=Lentilactobacillus sp. Marseille-Q4993 TaxID=3039492 RepID=UPI0024BBEF03|nr:hypothetical protein [Lentilactobacillus sp. Marseille-Q4993]